MNMSSSQDRRGRKTQLLGAMQGSFNGTVNFDFLRLIVCPQLSSFSLYLFILQILCDKFKRIIPKLIPN